jgi:hypothetical protein
VILRLRRPDNRLPGTKRVERIQRHAYRNWRLDAGKRVIDGDRRIKRCALLVDCRVRDRRIVDGPPAGDGDHPGQLPHYLRVFERHADRFVKRQRSRGIGGQRLAHGRWRRRWRDIDIRQRRRVAVADPALLALDEREDAVIVFDSLGARRSQAERRKRHHDRKGLPRSRDAPAPDKPCGSAASRTRARKLGARSD